MHIFDLILAKKNLATMFFGDRKPSFDEEKPLFLLSLTHSTHLRQAKMGKGPFITQLKNTLAAFFAESMVKRTRRNPRAH
ncbi:MAG: hypothetical protein MKZ95_13650 [Pirellulales bacterium]|nr:hypothetical protein [Pirellulales bacterium]HCK41472.1 hypothetical protein [Planctomycetaceae bacterium]